MHNHSTGRCLIECRRITSIVQKTHFIRGEPFAGGHTFEEQFEFIRNPRAVFATTASEYGPVRQKNLHLPKLLQPSAFPLAIRFS
jgi:hypothetical protein